VIKKISIVLTEPEALVYSDAINLLTCTLTKNKDLIENAVENVVRGLITGVYTMETVMTMSDKIEELAKFFKENRI
jgi:hypothetical protein